MKEKQTRMYVDPLFKKKIRMEAIDKGMNVLQYTRLKGMEDFNNYFDKKAKNEKRYKFKF